MEKRKIYIGADSAGRHCKRNSLVKARSVEGRSSAARVTHTVDAVFIYYVKVFEHCVNDTAHVPYTLAYSGSAVEDGRHCGNVAGRTLFSSAAFAKVSLLNGKGAKALSYYLACKVTVATLDGVLVVRVLRLSE